MTRRRGLCFLAFFVLGAIVVPGSASAAVVPPGPRLVFLELEAVVRHGLSQEEGEKLSRFGYVDTDAEGHDPHAFESPEGLVVKGSNLSWSADGSRFAFIAGKATLGADRKAAIYVARSDDTGVTRVATGSGTGTAVLSPDGSQVAFTRYRSHRPKIDPKDPLRGLIHSYASQSTWIVSTTAGRPHRLTPWANGRFSEPSSFSPDGMTLAVSTKRLGKETEVETIDLATGGSRTLVPEGSQAVYSPDGSQIAFISYRDRESVEGFDGPEGTSELYVADADGTNARRITHTPTLGSPYPAGIPAAPVSPSYGRRGESSDSSKAP